MFRFIAICALATIAAAAPGFVEQHHVVAAPVVAKVGAVVHSAPVATSHQSFTQFHNQAVITPVIKQVAPVVPVVKQVAPVVPVVSHVAPVVPVVKHVAPVVQHQTYVAPVSVVKTLPHAVSHQSHTQIHQKSIITPVVAPVIKTIATPVVKHVAVAPVAHVYHH
ncbi:PREDICTED: larval/pupal cuticle protein H1C isoform X2 [Drosophila arizonae]|uniref:Larval/pupal cuticle protein H1C isoform X2 n=1 Tax=Drosophila arizonae TaxID=7263 RepID=A0ABM1PAG0_DROAR|nr:PREDICTED: larval/pupal cuticle protein H1C-like isoform X2 [Drosophila arizonae]XP_017864196.1 PREDICTED: larval/pupal cuticle protein H1C isoform X2 [Drosophila arizonae]